jgi:hypothetical protein
MTLKTSFTLSELKNLKYSTDKNLNALLDIGVNLNFLTPAREIIYYSFDLQNVSDSKIYTPLSQFNLTQQEAARSILHYANSVTGIQFQEVALGQNADLHFANTDLYDSRVTALTNKYSNYQYNSQTGEIINYSVNLYVYFDNVEFKNENIAPFSGTQGYETLLHEIGHALGLKHPFESPYTLSAAQDNTNNTVMSYIKKGDYKTQFQALDLAALNWIYSADGLGGQSSSSASLAKIPQSIDFVQSSVNYTLPKNGENLRLTGTAKIGIGNEIANKLVGNDLANSLNGKAGNDTIEGGKGNDKLTGGTGKDTFIFNIKDYDFLGDFAPRAQNIDTITDFKKGEDKIELSAAFALKGFAVTKSLKLFHGDESLIYDSATRTLYFDADGQQTRYAPTPVIKFIGKVVLDSTDFQFINEDIFST